MNKCIKITFEFTRSKPIVLVGIPATKHYEECEEFYKDREKPVGMFLPDEEDKEMQVVIDRHKGSGAYK